MHFEFEKIIKLNKSCFFDTTSFFKNIFHFFVKKSSKNMILFEIELFQFYILFEINILKKYYLFY